MTTTTERGSASVELVLVVPVLVLIIGFIAFVGRLSSAQGDVQSAAGDAARAASLRGDPGSAEAAATAAAAATLADLDLSCEDLDVVLDASGFARGGAATVEVSCVVSFADVALGALPGSRTVTARVTEPVDGLRSDG